MVSYIKIPNDRVTTVISFYGGPSAGKSTAAAALYSAMKAEGKSVELIREYVKEYIWDERPLGIYEQIYFTAKQLRRESYLLGKVDFIVTDSPVWLNSFYAKKYSTELIYQACDTLCQTYYAQSKEDGHKRMNLWQHEVGPYEQDGRAENEQEARDITTSMREFLDNKGLSFIEQKGNYKITYGTGI